LLILAQVECDQSDIFLPSILGLSDPTKAYVAGVVENFKNDDRVRYVEFAGDDAGNMMSIHVDDMSTTMAGINKPIGIEYDKESKQHFADKDRMIQDQTKLISTLHSRIEDMQKMHATQLTHLENVRRELEEKLLSAESLIQQEGRQEDEISSYKKNIQYLENRVHELTQIATSVPELRSLVSTLQARVKELEHEPKGDDLIEQKQKEISDFLASGGIMGGGVRDRVIATLQQQLVLRDQEINFHRDERNRGMEHHKKTEKLLVSAVHSIALRYHEEMVARYDSDGSPMHQQNCDTSAHADSMYGS